MMFFSVLNFNLNLPIYHEPILSYLGCRFAAYAKILFRAICYAVHLILITYDARKKNPSAKYKSD